MVCQEVHAHCHKREALRPPQRQVGPRSKWCRRCEYPPHGSAVGCDGEAAAHQKEHADDEVNVGGRTEKYERMSALPIAKVKVAVRKHTPTRTEVLLTDVVVGVGAPLVGQGVVGV